MPTVRESPRERRSPGAKVAARERERLSGRGSLPARIAEGTIVAAAGVGVREREDAERVCVTARCQTEL